MKLESIGILINLAPFGERDCIARFFTRDFGTLSGMLTAAQIIKKKRPLIGQYGAVSWNARLDSSFGVFHFESEKNMSALIMQSAKNLAFMNSCFSLITALLPEREKYEILFDATVLFLKEIGRADSNAPVSENLYVNWEIKLLEQVGYALDTRSCSNCKSVSDLNYLSPKTGRAVCDDCAAPYLNRLYKLPITINTTGKFLENVCAGHGISVPDARNFIK